MSLYVNADWSALVPAGSPEARFGITPKDAKRRGLLPLEAEESPPPEPEHMHSANLIEEASPAPPEPQPQEEAKEAPKPANKARRKPRTK